MNEKHGVACSEHFLAQRLDAERKRKAVRLTERENDDALRYLSFKLEGQPELYAYEGAETGVALGDDAVSADGEWSVDEFGLEYLGAVVDVEAVVVF